MIIELILFLVLTIWAWRRGWKSSALLPVLILLGVCFFIGVLIAATNGNVESLTGICVLMDLGAIVALIYMIAKPPVIDEVIVKEEDFKFDQRK